MEIVTTDDKALSAVADFTGAPMLSWLNNHSESFQQTQTAHPAIYFTVGPEGGFHPDELPWWVAKKFTPVSLGARILRAETAAIKGLALIQSVLGDG
jgi:RsmE family RNA methyltransferase